MSGRLIITPYNIELEVGQPVTLKDELITGYNLAPARPLSLLRLDDQQLTLESCFWSFTPPWMKRLHEAPYIVRSEKLESSAMYAESWQQRRCILPVTGYYLWLPFKGRKQPFAVRRAHNRPFFLAGIWTRYPVAPDRHYDSFGLISVPADPWLGRLAERVPLMLAAEDISTWLAPETPLNQARRLLEQPSLGLEFYPVSDAVNNPDNQSAQVATPCGERLSPKQPLE